MTYKIWLMHKRTKIVLYIFLTSAIYFIIYPTLGFLNSSKLKRKKFIKPAENSTLSFLGTHIPLPEHLIGKQLSFDHVYEPRKVGFPPDLSNFTTSKDTKTILLWTRWNHLRKTINYYSLQKGRKSLTNANCPNSNCIVTYSRRNLHRADAVLFHLLDTKTKDLPTERYSRQVWILYNMEPPWLITRHHPSDLYLLDNKFNWTMSYRADSDIPSKYGFILQSEISRPHTYSGILKKKSKSVVWLVSDCVTDSRREDYVKELQKYIDVHTYGSCGNYTCYPSQSSSCYDNVLRHYKFYLSFENAICKDYVTEKFFNVFNYDIVPIVFGAANYSSIAPKGSYIDAAEYPQPKVLAEILIKIADNEQIYTNFLRKKSVFRAYLDPWVCKLCNKLHATRNTSILHDVEKWFIEDAQCKKWDIESQSYTNLI